MKIKEILRETQPKTLSKLTQKKRHTKEKLTEKDVIELMGHSAYKRGSGGAIRQVR